MNPAAGGWLSALFLLAATLAARGGPIPLDLGRTVRPSPLAEWKVDPLVEEDAALPLLPAEASGATPEFSLYLRNPALMETRMEDQLGVMDRMARLESSTLAADLREAILDMDWGRALDQVQVALGYNPGDPDANRQAGMLHALAGSLALADAHLREAVRADPRHVETLNAWAQVLFRLGRFNDSLRVASRAADLDPASLHARFTLACLTVALRQPVPSPNPWRREPIPHLATLAIWLHQEREVLIAVVGEEGFQTVCETVLGGGSARQIVLLAKALPAVIPAMEAGDWTEALAQLRLTAGYGVQGVWIGLETARCLHEGGKREDALRLLLALTGEYGDVADTWYGLGYALVEGKLFQQAATALDRARMLRPEDPMFHFAWCCAQAAQGRLDEAWPELSRLDREHPGRMPELMRGEEDYLRAIRRDPRYPSLRVAASVPP